MKSNLNMRDFFWNRQLGDEYQTGRYHHLESERMSALKSHNYQTVKQIEKEMCKHVAVHFEVKAYMTKDSERARAYERKAHELKNHSELYFVGAN